MFYLKYFVLPHNELEILSQTPNYVGIMTIILQKIPSGSIGHPKQYFTFKLILQRKSQPLKSIIITYIIVSPNLEDSSSKASINAKLATPLK